VLERGYAVVRQLDGSVVRVAAQVARGEMLDIEVADGRLRARAEGPDDG
jgi:exodeoxyribonuclease VII large subunit